jgi:hypothetical protein
LAESLTPDHFRRWLADSRALPTRKTAVLTSFPRSGTTLLEQMLDSHSGLVSSDEREAFARDIFPAMWLTPATPLPTAQLLDAIPMPKLAALRQRYLAYMESALNEPIGNRVHLDKNPTLTLLLPAVPAPALALSSALPERECQGRRRHARGLRPKAVFSLRTG